MKYRPMRGCCRPRWRATLGFSRGPTRWRPSGKSSSTCWARRPRSIFYEQGSWGPREADRLLPAGDEWHNP